MCFTFNQDDNKMKKFLNISLWSLLALSALTLGSCKNEVDEIFDEDAVTRLEKAKAQFTDILTSNGGKWQMEYFANADEPGYIYVMTFRKDGSVTISGKNKWIGGLSGNTGTDAYGSETSLWEVVNDNGPVLSFNSYNKYFHVFSDPTGINEGDENGLTNKGRGHEGDYEFDLMKYSNDTLYVSGKKHGINMIMTRIDETINDEVYINEVFAMADSFFHRKIPQVYINLPNGVRWIVKNGSTKILTMFREGDDEITQSQTHNIIITHDGLSFMNPLTLDGYVIQNFVRQPDGSLICRDDNQTTMTADELSKFIGATTLTWVVDQNQNNMGGIYADYIPGIKSEFNDFGSYKLSTIDIAYVSSMERYSITFNAKKKTTTYTPTFYFTIEPIGDDQVKFTFDPEGNPQGEMFIAQSESLKNMIQALGNATYDLSANSLLAPLTMKLAESGNSSNFMYWKLQ